MSEGIGLRRDSEHPHKRSGDEQTAVKYPGTTEKDPGEGQGKEREKRSRETLCREQLR